MIEALADFRETLNELANIEIVTTDEEGKWNKTRHFKSLSAVQLEEMINSSQNLCFLNGIKSERIEPEDPGANHLPGNWGFTRAKNTEIYARNIFSIDLDFKDCTFLFNGSPEDPEQRKQLAHQYWNTLKSYFAAAELMPWLVNFTGNGLHFHWKFEEPIEITNPKEWTKHYEAVAEALQREVFDLGNAKGQMPIDAVCKNPARILRIPGTMNTKPGIKPARGALLHYDASGYIDSYWEQHAPQEARDGAWGAARDGDGTAERDSSVEALREALDAESIFKHLGVTIHNAEHRTDGQWWCTSLWRKGSKPIEQSTPSFCWNPTSKVWKCFSSDKGGDAFALIGELRNLDYKKADDFAKILDIAEDVTGLKRQKKSNVVNINSRRIAGQEDFAQLLAQVPLEANGPELVDALDPVMQLMASYSEAGDQFYFDIIRDQWNLSARHMGGMARRVKALRKELEREQKQPRDTTSNRGEHEFNPQAYFDLFDRLGIAHDKLSGKAVFYSPPTEFRNSSNRPPYTLVPARLDFCDNREQKQILEAEAEIQPDTSYRHVHRMLAYWTARKKKPQYLIKSIDPKPYEHILDSAVGQIVTSFLINEDNNTDAETLTSCWRFTHEEIAHIYMMNLVRAHHRADGEDVRPVIPVLVSRGENIGKDTAIGTMLFWWGPYVKRLSFGKGSQEKEIQYAFATSLIQHIDEFERVSDMNPAFTRSLFTSAFADVTLKGNNNTTRLQYKGYAFGTANSTAFLTAGADNSRFIPIVIHGIDKAAYTPRIELAQQCWAQSKEISKSGPYELPAGLWSKITSYQRYYASESEGAAFVEIFTYQLANMLQQNSQGAQLADQGFLTIQQLNNSGIFEAIQEQYPGYRNLTPYQLRQLLKQGGLYDPSKTYYSKVTQARSKGIEIPQSVRALISKITADFNEADFL